MVHVRTYYTGGYNDALLSYRLPAKGRPEDSLPSLVQLGHNDVLCLVGTGLSGEVHQDWLVHVLGELLEQVVLWRDRHGGSANRCGTEGGWHEWCVRARLNSEGHDTSGMLPPILYPSSLTQRPTSTATHQDVDGLACPCGPHKEHRFLVLHHQIHQISVAHGVHCGYNDGDEVGILMMDGEGRGRECW